MRAARLAERWWTIATLLVCLGVLVCRLIELPGQLTSLRTEIWPLLRLWPDPTEQARQAIGANLVDALRETDRRLPIDAPVALLTSGQDVSGVEYVAFHRALYELAPRPVWWLAPGDTQRRPRWFQTVAPDDDAALVAAAHRVGADWLLAYQVPRAPAVGEVVSNLGHGTTLHYLGQPPVPAGRGQPARAAGVLWPLQASLGLLALLGLGRLLLSIPERAGLRPTSQAERLALAWVLGTLAASLGLLAGCAAGLGLRTSTWLLSAAGLGGLGGWLLVGRRGRVTLPVTLGVTPLAAVTLPVTLSQATKSRVTLPVTLPVTLRVTPGVDTGVDDHNRLAPRAATWGLLLALAAMLGFVALLAVGRPLMIWDSWVTWGMKARLIFEANAIPTGVWGDPTRAATLLEYPLLVPLTQAWLYVWLGAADDRLAGLAAVATFAALVAIVYAGLRGGGASQLVALAGATYVATMSAVAGLAGLVFADVPLGLLALVAGVYLVRWLDGGPPGALLVAAVAAGGLAWTKTEGLVLLILLIVAMLLVRGARPGAWRAAPVLALAGLAIAGPWLAFVAWHGIVAWQFAPPSPVLALSRLDRLIFVAITFGRYALWPGWNLVFPLAAALGIGLVARAGVGWFVSDRQLPLEARPPPAHGPRPIDWLPLVIMAYLGALGASFLFSTFEPYQVHVLAAVGRLLGQVAPLLAFWLVARWLELRPRPAAAGPP